MTTPEVVLSEQTLPPDPRAATFQQYLFCRDFPVRRQTVSAAEPDAGYPGLPLERPTSIEAPANRHFITCNCGNLCSACARRERASSRVARCWNCDKIARLAGFVVEVGTSVVIRRSSVGIARLRPPGGPSRCGGRGIAAGRAPRGSGQAVGSRRRTQI